MGKAKTKGKHRLDKFYYLAKEQGYRSRSAFKLVQLDRKYRFLGSSQSLLDLCAAPGGWMQVAVKSMPVGALVIGVDLVPIRPVRGALTLQEDITTPKCASSILKLLKQRGQTLVDVVLHDGSPNVGGAWAKEATTQAALVLDSLKLATKFLAPKGTFVTKVFRSQDYNSLLYALNQLFEKVEVTKPMASRATSAEIYVIGIKYLAPAKIDPRLLDARHLFQEIPEPPKVVDVLRGSKQKRHRDGYEDASTTFRKDCTAADFVWAEKPLELLGTITSISFDGSASSSIKDHTSTTDEIWALCEDLRVLGKKEFKQILKWRMQVRKALSTPASADGETVPAKSEAGEEKDDDDENDEEGLLNKMEELKDLVDAKSKKSKKKAAKRKQKLKTRTATGMQVDVMEDQYADASLFSLAAIKAKKDLDRVEDASDDENASASEDEILNVAQPVQDEDSDLDSDVERQRYNAELESYLDRAYDRYCSAKDGSTMRRKRARMANAGSNEKLWEEQNDSELEANTAEVDEEEEEANPLVVSLPIPKPSKEQIAQQWFSQDIFADLDEKHESDSDDEIKLPNGAPATSLKQNAHDAAVKKENGTGRPNAEDDFEVVPMEPSGSSDSSSSEDEDEYDSDTKAEILTYAKKMLRKKDREKLIDDSYNRYMFNDDALPEWFADDEKRHCQIQKPFTKDEVLAVKSQFRAIDARPVKKVAEAKARKKRRTMKRLEQARSKATAIADQPDITPKSKNKIMEKLYKKAVATKGPKRELVVAKKGVAVRAGKGKSLVDRRMKKDARSRGSGKPGSGKKSRVKPMKKSGKKSTPMNKKAGSKGGRPGSKGGRPGSKGGRPGSKAGKAGKKR